MAIQSLIQLKSIKTLSLVMDKPFHQEDLILLASELTQLTRFSIAEFSEGGDRTKITVNGLTKILQVGQKLKIIYLNHIDDLHFSQSAITSLLNAIKSGEPNRDVAICITNSNISFDDGANQSIQKQLKIVTYNFERKGLRHIEK